MEMMWQEFGVVSFAESGLIGRIYQISLLVTMLILAVLIILSIIRSVLGPGISDRIIAVNMIGTIVIMLIAVLSLILDQNYLADVCLIYAMISFLGVVVLCKVYTGVYLKKKHKKANLGAIDDNLLHQDEVSPERDEQRNDLTKNKPIQNEYGKGEQTEWKY